ncbi:MAG: hypothetical protein D6734_03595 [Candidatus Schekmanbacteria bacterium]|nr:MAG: hypothetical protein D6734_03595 [Candidatus Schekmanbacteria bacterium]
MAEKQKNIENIHTLKAPSSLFEIRRGIYKFLSAVFLNPPTVELIRIFSDANFLSELEDLFGDDVSTCFKEFTSYRSVNFSELEQEYRDLFRIPLGKYVTPYESVYLGTKKVGDEVIKGQLMGPHTISVKKFYEMCGIDTSETNEIVDHIGLELEAMHILCVRHYELISEGKEEEAKNLLNLQKRFMNEHLSRWADDLCKNVYEKSDSNFYKGIALLTSRFIEMDKNTLDELVP